MLLIKKFRIGPVTGPRSSVLVRDRRPWANTAVEDPLLGQYELHLLQAQKTLALLLSKPAERSST